MNAVDTIRKAIFSLQDLTADIIVSDSGSTDGTIQVIKDTGVTTIEREWKGYGANKNAAGALARHDWLLSLDADEYVLPAFSRFLQALDLQDPHKVYQFKRLNFLGDTPIRYGEWSKDKVTRLFNRTVAAWDDAPVHEQLKQILQSDRIIVVKTEAVICHRTAPDIATYRAKIKKYAVLMADKYFMQGKKISPVKLYLSPLFNFLQNYFLRLGLLDGKAGFEIAVAHAGYTFHKYRLLSALYKKNPNGKNQLQ